METRCYCNAEIIIVSWCHLACMNICIYALPPSKVVVYSDSQLNFLYLFINLIVYKHTSWCIITLVYLSFSFHQFILLLLLLLHSSWFSFHLNNSIHNIVPLTYIIIYTHTLFHVILIFKNVKKSVI